MPGLQRNPLCKDDLGPSIFFPFESESVVKILEHLKNKSFTAWDRTVKFTFFETSYLRCCQWVELTCFKLLV